MLTDLRSLSNYMINSHSVVYARINWLDKLTLKGCAIKSHHTQSFLSQASFLLAGGWNVTLHFLYYSVHCEGATFEAQLRQNKNLNATQSRVARCRFSDTFAAFVTRLQHLHLWTAKHLLNNCEWFKRQTLFPLLSTLHSDDARHSILSITFV